jgi:hypothetical protein
VDVHHVHTRHPKQSDKHAKPEYRHPQPRHRRRPWNEIGAQSPDGVTIARFPPGRAPACGGDNDRARSTPRERAAQFFDLDTLSAEIRPEALHDHHNLQPAARTPFLQLL